MDKSGAIDKKEMVKVMNSIYAMLGDESGARTQKLNDLVCFLINKTYKEFFVVFQATAHAAKLFKEVDLDGDGELNEEEFITGCKKDKVLMEKLQRIVDQCMGKQ